MANSWVKNFRTALKLNIGKGWTVGNSRGSVRIFIGQKPNIISLNTSYRWSEDTWIDAFNRIVLLHKIYTEAKGKLDLKNAYAICSSGSSEVVNDWAEALETYRAFKTNVSDKTWKSKHQPVLHIVLELLNKKKQPKNGEDLSVLALSKWTKGTQQRRHMRIALYSFLN